MSSTPKSRSTRNGLSHRSADVWYGFYDYRGTHRMGISDIARHCAWLILHLRWKMSKRKENLDEIPPATFVHDLNYACNTFRDVQRLCGVSVVAAHRLLAGEPVRRDVLLPAMSVFYGNNVMSPIKIQMEAQRKLGVKRWRRLTGMLRAAARFVNDYYDSLRIRVDESVYWVFPPRDTLLRLSNVCSECRELLKLIHKTCPEYDKDIYSDTPDLLNKLSEERLKKTNKGTSVRSIKNNEDNSGE